MCTTTIFRGKRGYIYEDTREFSRCMTERLCRFMACEFLQVHDMEFAPSLDIIWRETLPALQKVKDAGKARFIGITGYPMDNFRRVIENSPVQIDTILTYCHFTMNDSSLLQHLPYFEVHLCPLGGRYHHNTHYHDHQFVYIHTHLYFMSIHLYIHT
jgi:hypothetical protein